MIINSPILHNENTNSKVISKIVNNFKHCVQFYLIYYTKIKKMEEVSLLQLFVNIPKAFSQLFVFI